MGRERDAMYEEDVYQRFCELEREGYSYRTASRLAREQIVHDHDPRDEED
jgi:hypothetical protein